MATDGTLYDVLGVDPDARAEDIRKAYLRAARHHHPDRHAHSSDTEQARADDRMREINEAYKVLGSATDRAAYDRSRRGASFDPFESFLNGETGPLHEEWKPFDVAPAAAPTISEHRGASLPTWLKVAPMVGIVLTVLSFVAALALGMRAGWAIAFICLAITIALFFVAPFLVMARSEKDARL